MQLSHHVRSALTRKYYCGVAHQKYIRENRKLLKRFDRVCMRKTLHNMSPPPSSRDMTYQWHEDVEDLEEYCHGGYHPISINDELH